MALRFRGYLPVVIDVETAGFNCKTDALLEIAAVTLQLDETGRLRQHESHAYHVEPFPGAKLNPEALAFNASIPIIHSVWRDLKPMPWLGLSGDPTCRKGTRLHPRHPGGTQSHLRSHLRQRRRGALRHQAQSLPSLQQFRHGDPGALAYGQTVLARAVQAAGLDWDSAQAHSARYDAERTAALFCTIFNRWEDQQATPFTPYSPAPLLNPESHDR